jgi:hypothetical protein
MQSLNPFDDTLACEHSSYTAFRDGHLVHVLEQEKPIPALAEFVHSQVRALVLEPHFACVGARAALNQSTYRFGMYPALTSPAATAGLCRDLFTFVSEQQELGGDFTTFIASFDGPTPQDEEHFERLAWSQLQALHDRDHVYHGWDPSVSPDPEDPRFSFSFAGRAFFIVGLHPGSARWARRFAWPTLVFNAHYQFERLRATGRFARFQQVIRDRDRALQGHINPNLANFGDRSEARQYSGRPVGDEWRCPLHVHRGDE